MNSPFDQFTAQQLQLFQIFHPYAFSKVVGIINNKTRFVHYTSADAAMQMIDSRQVWMRKSSCMNDYMEIEHGFDCLNAAYKKQRDRFSSIFDEAFPSFCKKLEDRFNGWLPHFRSDSYITCISEHDDDEDVTGRLSMWRAYGRTTGVAVILNSASFLSPSDALKAYTHPVAYLGADAFNEYFDKLVSSIQSNLEMVKSLSEEVVLSYVFEAFRSAILCTKHPGFREEREWRVIYTPSYGLSDRLKYEIVSVNGVPQPIYKIPLEDVPSEGLVGIEVPNLVNRVIIGPTQFPWAIREAFVTKLKDAGMLDAEGRVFISDIPLRL